MSEHTLHTIVYISTATRLMSVPELEEILRRSRQCNGEQGVTGLLLYSDGAFAQCIEGNLESVDATYARIKTSSQHRNITELLNEPIQARSFPDWQMGFLGPREASAISLPESEWRWVDEARGAVSAHSLVFPMMRKLRESLNV